MVLITEIYPAGEKPIKDVSGRTLYEEIQSFGHKNAFFEPDLAQVPERVADIARKDDILLVLGAGSIYRTIPDIIEKLKRN